MAATVSKDSLNFSSEDALISQETRDFSHQPFKPNPRTSTSLNHAHLHPQSSTKISTTSNSQPQQEIFKPDQYFWCQEGNEHIANWVANNKDHPRIYATYINDANQVLQRKRDGRLKTNDEQMLAFLEEYPMTSTSVIEGLAWYRANVSKPSQTGLINVASHGGDPKIVGQARDLLYKQVFDHAIRHNHWVKRGEHGLLNPNEVEPLSKKQKNHMRSQARWAKLDERRGANEAAGPTGEVRRLMSGLEVAGQEESQGKADDDVDMED